MRKFTFMIYRNYLIYGGVNHDKYIYHEILGGYTMNINFFLFTQTQSIVFIHSLRRRIEAQ